MVDLPETVASLASSQGRNGIERGDADEGLAGDRRGRGSLDLIKVPPHMAPTEGELDIAALGEFGIGAVAVDLQLAAEAGKMLGRPHMLAVGGIGIGDAWRVGAGPRPFVAGIGPQLPFLGAAGTP